jgi:hypothetical protein
VPECEHAADAAAAQYALRDAPVEPEFLVFLLELVPE